MADETRQVTKSEVIHLALLFFFFRSARTWAHLGSIPAGILRHKVSTRAEKTPLY
jgi:hypothetical protein